MGGAKRAMEEHESKLAHALAIAVQAGVVSTCELHEDVYLEGNEDIEAAYRLGNSQFTAGKIDGVFESRREMTDLIQQAVADNAGDECYICAKWRDE